MPTSTTGMGEFTTVFDGLSTGITTAYTGNQATLSTHSSETAAVYIDYVNGNETSIQLRVEVWDKDNGWHVVPFSQAAFDLSLSADGNERIGIRRLGRFESSMRISVKSTGSADAATSVTVKVQLGHSRFPIAGNTV